MEPLLGLGQAPAAGAPAPVKDIGQKDFMAEVIEAFNSFI